jgi:putative nucleotidyltransferase with HDIG domain
MARRPALSVVASPSPADEATSSTSTAQDGRLGEGRPPVERRHAPRPPRARWISRASRLLVLVVVAVVGAVAVAPRLVKGDLPTDEALLGTPARGVVRADRDYALVDDVATNELRRAAAERALPVWDLNDERARRDAGVVQKALVRVAVALEAHRRDVDPMPAETPGAVRAALDPVRAIVAGELADVGLDAPQDDAWRALLNIVWNQPSVVDVIGSSFAVEFVRPILASGQRAQLPSGPVLVRALSSTHDERTVDAHEIVDERVARADLRAHTTALLVAAAPTGSNVSTTTWTAWSTATATWLSTLPRSTLSWNAAETDARRRASGLAVPPVVVRAHRGEIVLRPGEIIAPRHRLLAQAMAVQQGDGLRTRATLGTAFFIGLLCGVVYLFGSRRVFQRRLRTRDVVLLGVLLACQLGFLVVADAVAPALVTLLPGVPMSVVAFAIPIAFGPMCARVTLPPDVALLFALVSALLGGVVVEAGMSWAVVAVLTSMTGAAIVMRGPRRLTMLLAGAGAGAVGVFAALTLELFRGALGGVELLALLGATFIGGVLSGLLALVCMPVVELAFGYVTDGRLYRLADMNHPLLKDLIVRAPGTWHHSVRTAVAAEAAAEAIGAHPLLARVMALYHDVGKIVQPQSFRENQTGDNPHDRLAPDESAALLRSHVVEGLALARRHGIPDAVADAIEEHHADLVMEPLLRAARARAGNDVADRVVAEGILDDVVDERAFRYAGRVPRTRESALVMLADQIESAARNVDDGAAADIDAVVDAVVNRALALDLLAGCDLSLRDLGRVRAALKTALRDLERGVGGLDPKKPEPT